MQKEEKEKFIFKHGFHPQEIIILLVKHVLHARIWWIKESKSYLDLLWRKKEKEFLIFILGKIPSKSQVGLPFKLVLPQKTWLFATVSTSINRRKLELILDTQFEASNLKFCRNRGRPKSEIDKERRVYLQLSFVEVLPWHIHCWRYVSDDLHVAGLLLMMDLLKESLTWHQEGWLWVLDISFWYDSIKKEYSGFSRWRGFP